MAFLDGLLNRLRILANGTPANSRSALNFTEGAIVSDNPGGDSSDVRTVGASPTVASVAAMRAFPPVGFSRVRLGGEAGGEFVWDGASLAPDDGGTVVAATGYATGRWIRQFDGIRRAHYFGVPRTVDTADALEHAFPLFSFPAGSACSASLFARIAWAAADDSASCIEMSNAVTITSAGVVAWIGDPVASGDAPYARFSESLGTVSLVLCGAVATRWAVTCEWTFASKVI